MWATLEKLSLSPGAVSNSSQSTKMVLVAAAASVSTAAVLLGYQGLQRRNKNGRSLTLKKNKPTSDPVLDMESLEHISHDGYKQQQHRYQKQQTTGKKVEFSEELIQEQLARNIAFLGEEGVQKLRDSFVIVVGAGGVGSWAASMLIKSGVGKIRIIDFDQISLTGLNLHASASRLDIGKPKAIALKEYFREIAPWAEVDAHVERLDKDSAARLLADKPDYVVDAIGDLGTKLQLLKYCHENQIPAISSLSAGIKADPSRVLISDISETFEDPLAKVVRRRLKRLGVDYGIEVVYSSEKPYKIKPKKTSLPLTGSETPDNGYRILPDFPSNTKLPVLVPLPAMFGMSMATFIICKLGGWEMEPLSVKFRMELYQRLHRNLKALEETRFNMPVDNSNNDSDDDGNGKFPLNRHDIGYLVEEMFRSRSAISASMDKIAICRWRRDEKLSLLNAVVLTEREMERHLALPKDADLLEVYGKDVVDYVEGRYKEEEQISHM
ncbi:hypothetical protein BX616_004708 [Lobosporangium transversale]|uniref:THIF-type NAD/FAD binding fold domain-containing protein n=1 Tax=Lobosporangium transversale TaxID=64571 RepID=A0A1Y2GGA5_9FUNG|nr:hypothetical protein BCR41DRAFT_360686 [Lobosporangium transversale]KAF9897953.1 hypothetical protein BX616_004708 [Lobosporangium transversale]ORZ06780.1 hypothetical protein BCR41DRAFT_360686 [Lobosporangium transversale]|eukprot:XP_021877701.1 hypothetical protein BCR41DRAFT_360686 [Lobosporangium transversale]